MLFLQFLNKGNALLYGFSTGRIKSVTGGKRVEIIAQFLKINAHADTALSKRGVRFAKLLQRSKCLRSLTNSVNGRTVGPIAAHSSPSCIDSPGNAFSMTELIPFLYKSFFFTGAQMCFIKSLQRFFKKCHASVFLIILLYKLCIGSVSLHKGCTCFGGAFKQFLMRLVSAAIQIGEVKGRIHQKTVFMLAVHIH